MAGRFEGKVVWVTGASSGIGAATARAFLGEGAKVIVSARRRERLEQLRDAAGGDANRVAVLPMDLGDAGSLGACVERANGAFGAVDVVVHNGAFRSGRVRWTRRWRWTGT
jgi:NADP-dependent 3-hydroxy acid dehydrogenase YdfG